ncbi:TetR family transcriptional regulator [Microbacterium sp. STN6]|uniref:TetR/AcrR family transcriptional regulator n=1 Tax=Microbacterium sp. STN6 TaxID=2995588 RepID=UPI002260C117|nr:TetR family transcriptional regulator [Microbacterium sp. STN6]MCX7521846.1 TetR family transcriptional regulator [Microbacterium sp. STN6]
MTRIPVGERRDALVRAALRVVAAHGVTAATTRAIVAEAGMPLASFHYVFGSRDELMAALVSHVVDEEALSIAPALAPGDEGISVRDALRGGLQRYFDAVRDDPDREKAMLELTHYALRSGTMAPLARRQYERYYELAASALRVAEEKSGCRWRRPVDELARLLVTLTDGLTLGWLVGRDDAVAASVMDFAADALAAYAEES